MADETLRWTAHDAAAAVAADTASLRGQPMTSERRRFQRVSYTVSVECRRVGDPLAYWYKGLTLNVSAGGVALEGVFLFEAGTKLELQIKFSDRPEPLRLFGQVV